MSTGMIQPLVDSSCQMDQKTVEVWCVANVCAYFEENRHWFSTPKTKNHSHNCLSEKSTKAMVCVVEYLRHSQGFAFLNKDPGRCYNNLPSSGIRVSQTPQWPLRPSLWHLSALDIFQASGLSQGHHYTGWPCSLPGVVDPGLHWSCT